MCSGKVPAGPGRKDTGQSGATHPKNRLSAYFAPIFFSASLFNNSPHPLTNRPPPPPPTPTHSYTDTVSRVMFPDLHVPSLRKYSFGNQRLRT